MIHGPGRLTKEGPIDFDRQIVSRSSSEPAPRQTARHLNPCAPALGIDDSQPTAVQVQ